MRFDHVLIGALLLTVGCGNPGNPDGTFGMEREGGRGQPSLSPGEESVGRRDRTIDDAGQARQDDQGDDARARAAWDRARNGTLVAQVSGTRDHRDVWGVVRLRAVGGQVEVESAIDGLPAGTHAYHVHEHGDCSAPAEESMGPHLKFQQLAEGTAASGSLQNREAGEDGLQVGTGIRPGVHGEGQDARVIGEEGATGRPGVTGSGGLAGGQAVDGQTAPGTPNAGGTQGDQVAGGAGTTQGQGTGATGTGGTQGDQVAGTTPETAGQATPGTGAQGDVAQTTDPGAATTPSPAVDGNLGELVAKDGSSQTTAIVPNLSPEDLPSLVGRAVVIHEHGNMAETPSGDAGAPIACGVIGVAGREAPIVPADMLEDDIPAEELPPVRTPPARGGEG